jgi:hypothetical protein
MGILAQSALTGTPRARDEAGVALASAIFGLVALSLLITGAFVLTDLQARATLNRERAARAMHVAEAGLTHALATIRLELRDTSLTRLLRGLDNVANTSDDGYLIGYPIDPSLWIPASGRPVVGGTYFVRFGDDPADADGDPARDSNGEVLAQCRSTTPDGAVAEIEAIVSLTLLPGVVVDGTLEVGGSPEIVGACGGLHANTDLAVSGGPTVDGRVTAGNQATSQQPIYDSHGNPVTPLSHQPPLEVPELSPLDYCADADYVLQPDGYVREVSTGVLHDARSDPQFGWKRIGATPVKWSLSAGSAAPGTVCADGNVTTGNVGSAAAPLTLTLIASGSIEISGNPYIQSDHPEKISMMAGGDLKFSGQPDALSQNYSGLLYAGAQCLVSGNPRIQGQLVCKNGPNPSGSIDLTAVNEIKGSPELTFGCGTNLLARRRILYWYPRLGA